MRPAPPPGTALRIRAPAKVNLLLRILGRRSDGFHEVETIFQAVDLCDTLTVTVTESPGFRLAVLDDQGEPVELGPVEDNLVTRARDLFFSEVEAGSSAGRGAGVAEVGLHVRLVKRIPAGAGLGGGSSDAGAFLRALNHLMGEPIHHTRLSELGGTLGADVAFFAGTPGRATGTGRGDRLAPGPDLPERTVVLGLPPVHVATAGAYARLARHREGEDPPASVLPQVLAALRSSGNPVAGGAGGAWATLARWAVNDFEAVVADPHPEIQGALAALTATNCEYTLLSGSGAAVFGILPPGSDAGAVLQALRRTAPLIRWVGGKTLGVMPAAERVAGEEDFG